MINASQLRRDVFVIGGSAGSIEALLQLLGALPAELPATVGIVLHRSPHFESKLAQVFQRSSRLPIVEPAHGERISEQRVYVAPRDQHMLFEDGVVQVNRGPRQHFTRPAVDPLFISAAEAYGPRVVGILLSGGGDDGTSGLIAIKAKDGLTIAQDPLEARHSSMPASGIRHDRVDAVLKLEEMAPVIEALAHGRSVNGPPEHRHRVSAPGARRPHC
jgi:two-component system, chemotaxis family, protein-glutamate methylesterase/glutaminase